MRGWHLTALNRFNVSMCDFDEDTNVIKGRDENYVWEIWHAKNEIKKNNDLFLDGS